MKVNKFNQYMEILGFDTGSFISFYNIGMLSFYLAITAGMYYLLLGAEKQTNRYLGELISPILDMNNDLSEFDSVKTISKGITVYKQRDMFFYIEDATPYKKSKLLKLYGLESIGQTEYRKRSIRFESRMMAIEKSNAQNCSEYRDRFMIDLQSALNSKPWPLDFGLEKVTVNETSIGNGIVTKIKRQNFAGYRVPMIIARCNESTFLLLVTLDH